MDDREEVEAASTLPDKFTASDVQRVISAHHFRLSQLEDLTAEIRATITNLSVDFYSQMTDAADVLDQIIEQANRSFDQISAEFVNDVLIDHIELEEPERDRTEELADNDGDGESVFVDDVNNTDEGEFFLTEEGDETDGEEQG